MDNPSRDGCDGAQPSGIQINPEGAALSAPVEGGSFLPSAPDENSLSSMDNPSRDGCDGAQPSGIQINPEGAALSAPVEGGSLLTPPPCRKHPVHLPVKEMPNRANIIFVTVCSKDRKPIFAQDDVQALILESWKAAEHWLVGKYVIMPDHIHLFCTPGIVEYPSLKKWVKFWKTLVSRKWPRPEEQPIWQVDFWDVQLRLGDRYSAKWEYVRNNPVRAGLVDKAEEWVFAGELNVLRWTE